MSDTTKAAPEPPKVPEPPKARSHGATEPRSHRKTYRIRAKEMPRCEMQSKLQKIQKPQSKDSKMQSQPLFIFTTSHLLARLYKLLDPQATQVCSIPSARNLKSQQRISQACLCNFAPIEGCSWFGKNWIGSVELLQL